MDKSESELLEEWDVVTVPSADETEKENDVQNSPDTDPESNNSDNNEDSNVDNDAETESVSNTIDGSEHNIGTQPKSIIEAESEFNFETETERSAIAFEPKSNIVSRSVAAQSEYSTIAAYSFEADPESSVLAESDNNAAAELKDDSKVEVKTSIHVVLEKSKDVVMEHNAKPAEQIINDDNIMEDIVHVDKPVDSHDSYVRIFEIESCGESYVQEAPEIVPEKIEIEHEMAAIESSSSDIDIIDENVEESVTSSFISPLSLSISSTIADTSSIHSFTSQSEDSKDHKSEQKTEGIERKEDLKKRKSTEKEEVKHTIHTKKSYHEDKTENVRNRRQEPQRTTNRQMLFNWFALFIEFFRNLSGYDWCIVGGVALSIYLTIVINQTNIFAIVQKDNAVSQMKDMIDELKHDNKILKEQMLSEIKNEKVLSSFEHQIKELRKENSKLTHMLYDVAKVLDKQKNSQEKKDAVYLAPFKKEINKLKEHINILKFDNEELQKQLVRMRYASYSQGGKDTDESKNQARKEDQAEEEAPAEEISLDIESLKKWNELITLLTKELGALSGAEGFKTEKPDSDSKNKNSKPFWKEFLNDFKGKVNDLRKINFSVILSDYRKANEKAVSDIYKSVKDFFTVEENSQHYTSEEDDSQWKNIGDFVNDLKEKWTNIKDRLYTSDLKKFFEKNFKKAAGESSHGEYHIQKGKGVSSEHTDSRTTDTHFDSEKKHEKIQTPEDTKWMFKRAAHREEVRKTDEEVNWFLKKGRHNPDDTEERHL